MPSVVQYVKQRISTLRDMIAGGAKAASDVAARFIPDLPLSHQQQRIGGDLTPAQVSQIYREADSGIIYRFVDLSNEAKQKDCTLQSTLGTRETALAPLGYSINPWRERDEEPTDENRGIAHFVEDALGGAIGDGQEMHSLTDTISDLLGAVYHGHSTSEIAWVKKDRFMVPRGFWHIKQRRFEFRESDGRLVFNDAFGFSRMNGIDLMAEKPGEYICHQPRINGDIPAREGLARPLNWAALFRNWGIGDWLALGELAYKPWRVGKYPGGKTNSKGIPAGKTDREDLTDVLRRMTTNGIAVIRDDMGIDLKAFELGAGAKDLHKVLCDFMGAEMAKAVLGQTLTIEAGERGARSLGEVHDRVRKDIREYDAIGMAATLLRDLIRWIVWLNFGADKPLPSIGFNTDDALDMATFTGGLVDATKAGVKIPLLWPNDQLGIPKPQKGEPLLGGGYFDAEQNDEENGNGKGKDDPVD